MLKELMTKIGYQFEDSSLLELACTHASVADQENNERLEFLGDAVLELVATDYLYKNFPAIAEGDLSRLRASVVKEEALYEVAQELKLGDYLYLGIGEEKTGGRKKPSILSDAYEAIAGALYLDGGLEVAQAFILQTLPQAIEVNLHGKSVDYKTRLQEFLQKEGAVSIQYKITDTKGPDHDCTFFSQLIINGDVKAEGAGHTKKMAEQEAAKKYLKEKNQTV